jgi:hypothetical protein
MRPAGTARVDDLLPAGGEIRGSSVKVRAPWGPDVPVRLRIDVSGKGRRQQDRGTPATPDVVAMAAAAMMALLPIGVPVGSPAGSHAGWRASYRMGCSASTRASALRHTATKSQNTWVVVFLRCARVLTPNIARRSGAVISR